MEQIQLTKSQKISLGTKEISKRIREQLKKEFPKCKFSVVTEYYSGGSAIHLNLMESDRKVIKDFDDISDLALFQKEHNSNYSKEDIKKIQETDNHQLNQYQLIEEYKVNEWCNGVFLTEEGHNLLKRTVEIVNQYNYDDSDIMTDYFDVNFYLHISLGKWNKPFIDKN